MPFDCGLVGRLFCCEIVLLGLVLVHGCWCFWFCVCLGFGGWLAVGDTFGVCGLVLFGWRFVSCFSCLLPFWLG